MRVKSSILAASLVVSFFIFLSSCNKKEVNEVKDTAPAVQTSTPKTASASADKISPLKKGDVIPDVTLKTSTGDPFKLKTVVSEKPAILIFYRGGWCPYCNTHLGKLQSIESELVKLGYQIIAISPDRPEKLKESIDKHALKYTVVSDSMMEASIAFGLAYKVDDKTNEKLTKYGIDLEGASGQKHNLLPVPAAIVVGTDGIIDFTYVNSDYKVRVEPDVLLAEAKAALK